MDLIRQAKSKLKPPPPPPPPRKPAHVSQQPTTTSSNDQVSSTTSRIVPSRNLCKRGLGWPWDYQPTLYPLFTHPNITWLFNWELWVPASLPQETTWVPCVRTAAQCTDIMPFLTDISANQGRPITHFLGFNEPEIPSQANLGVDEAVELWRRFVLPAKEEFGFRSGSPGLSSDVNLSVAWLDGFLNRLGGVQGAGVDFLVLHWYGLRFEEMKHFLEMMHQRYCLPVWVNEFACSRMGHGEASAHEVESFLRESLPWLEECPWIEKYAYFGNAHGQDVGKWVGRASNFTEPADGCEDTGGRRLSRLGKLYLEL